MVWKKNPGPGAVERSIMQGLCSGCYRNLKSEHNVARVDSDFTTAVETLKLKWWRVGGGSVTGVDRKLF